MKLTLLQILLVIFIFSGNLKAQQIDNIDFDTCKIDLQINPYKKLVNGSVSYIVYVKNTVDSVYVDARNINFEKVRINGSKPKMFYNKERLILFKKLKKGKRYTIRIDYNTKPEAAMYFIGWNKAESKKQVWTQGQGKNNSHWVPCIEDVREKMVYHLSVTFLNDFEVIANGTLKSVKTFKNNLKTWKFEMNKPMSSYLLAIAAGKYLKKTIYSKSKVPIELYYYPEDSARVEPTYRYTTKIFNFLEDKIGFSYPWQIYKQVPVKDFLYAGMENTTTTIFSDAYVVDSTAFIDKNYININAHEMAHQWFGNIVTAVSGAHHWLQEGFATYYALLAQRAIFGEDFYYGKLYESAKQLKELSKQGKGERLLNPNASSLTFYEKGSWILHMLARKIGEESLDKSVKEYLRRYEFGVADTDAFFKIAENISGMNLSHFKETWMVQEGIPEIIAEFDGTSLRILKNELDIAVPVSLLTIGSDSVFTIKKGTTTFLPDKNIKGLRLNYAYDLLIDLTYRRPAFFVEEELLNGSNQATKLEAFHDLEDSAYVFLKSDELLKIKKAQILKNYVIYQLAQKPDEETIDFFQQILQSDDAKLKQTITSSLKRIPETLKGSFENLLDEQSYVTVENALLKLWINYPEKRKSYLEKTKNSIGFNDKNIRMLWLALALLTPEYNAKFTPEYYDELSSYTDASYNFDIRRLAFTYLYQLQMLSNKNLEDLVNSGNHPVWRYASFAKAMVKTLLKDQDYHERIPKVIEPLAPKEKKWVVKLLEKTE